MKLITYNIQYSLGRDGRYDLARIADAVRGADVIALQEVERFWRRSSMIDQAAELGRHLPDYYWVYGPAFDVDASYRTDAGEVVNRRRQFGTMLLSRRPILCSRLYPLPKFDTLNHLNMDLGALEGVISTDGQGPLRFYSLHLNHISSRERFLQLDAVLDAHRRARINGAAAGSVSNSGGQDWSNQEAPVSVSEDAILMGDFNSVPGSAEYDRLVGPLDAYAGRVHHVDGFVDSWVAAGHAESEGITWAPIEGGREKGRRIDYCFVSARLGGCVESAAVDLEAIGSDHYPYAVEIRV